MSYTEERRTAICGVTCFAMAANWLAQHYWPEGVHIRT